MVDEVIETGPDALKKKRDELLLSIKTPEEPKLTSPDVMESVGETQRMNVLEREKKKGELEIKRAERESATARALSQKYESQYKDIPEFKPTPESKAELVGLFGLIGAIGAFGGGKSYGSALGAMNAMTGMMKGYQEGRKDLYEREKAAFDKNMQSIKAHNDQISAAFSRAKELAKTDLPAAERKLMTELKALDANVLATTLYKQGLMEADKARIEAYNKFNAQTDQSLRTVAALDKAIKEQGTRAAPIKVKGEDGKTYYADRAGNIMRDEKDRPMEAPETRGSATETRYSFNVAEAYGQAVADLVNITKLPKETVLGSFAGLTGKSGDSLLAGLRNTFARSITPDDQRAFQILLSGFESNMARALGGGYASSGAKFAIDQYKDQVSREGDTPEAKALFLARARQELDILARYYKNRPGAAPFTEEVQRDAEELKKAVPFTVDEVIAAGFGGAKPPAAAPAPKTGKPTLQQFIEKAKPLNPNMTDQQLIDYYNQTYGTK